MRGWEGWVGGNGPLYTNSGEREYDVAVGETAAGICIWDCNE